MSGGSSLVNLESPAAGPCDRAPDGAAALRARLLYLTKRRNELLAYAHFLIEVVDLLSADERLADRCRVLADLRTIKEHAHRAATIIGSEFVRDWGGEDASRAFSHDLRNCVGVIVGYGGDLVRRAPGFGLESFIDDFREVRTVGNRILSLVDSTISRLSSSDGNSAIDDVSLYLDRAAISSSAGDDPPAPPTAFPGRILVAEDNDPVRALLCEYLRAQGHDAVPVRDGGEALALVESSEFDLVMTDIEMPRANGFQIIEHLRSHPRYQRVPVIVISGHWELDGIAHCLTMGAEDYLPKPVNQIILKARVDACLEKKRLRDRNEQERLRYNDLLRAILPGPVVEELVETDTVKPRLRKGVAVRGVGREGPDPGRAEDQDDWRRLHGGVRAAGDRRKPRARLRAAGPVDDRVHPKPAR